MKKYRCKICCFTYEGEIDKEFSCSDCGADRTNFIDETIDKRVWVSEVNPSIVRINKKCINCGMCKSTCENKTGIKYDKDKVLQPICIHCGQCVMSCSTGALVPKYDYKKVLEYLMDPEYTVIVSIAPAVRVALGDEFGLEPGVLVTGKMISALKKANFDYVFDVCYGADLTILEEAHELIKRIKEKRNLPQFTSCCPAWIKYCEIYHEELLSHISTTKSPISMQGAILKSYFCEQKGLNLDKVITVTIAPCTAKKYEIKREELQGNDFVLTTSELALLLKEKEIPLEDLEEASYDSLLKEATGAAVLFGASGGVMEAALRTAYYYLEKEPAPKDFFHLESIRGLEEMKEAEVSLGDFTIKVAAVYGMPNVEQILKNKEQYAFIEVMNCPGGCVGGGGQPLVPQAKLKEYQEKRMETLYKVDEKEEKRSSYENTEIARLYNNYLDYPGSDKAKTILHTKYSTKKDMLETK